MEGILFVQDLAAILVVAGSVGWVCQRLGISAIAGFLVAGILVGPHMPRMSLVEDLGRVETLAELGLVFLMFSMGMRLSIAKLRRMGVSLLIGTFAGAIGVYYLARVLGAALEWTSLQSLFLAGMLMVSSSAIVTKVLQENSATHERFGQLALGLTVLEDVIAVVMLTILNSYVQMGGAPAPAAPIGAIVGTLAAFVVLAVVTGMLLVPWLLRRMSIGTDESLQTLGIAALLFGLAWLAQRAGYSLALGAFLLGTIVGETAHRHQVERTFDGMRDVFSAVFFVAMGMQVDPRELWSHAGLILGVAAFTLVVRPVVSGFALVVIGTPLKDGLRAGLSVAPIGEFSFIIAQLGVGAAVLPPEFFPLAVGVSLFTTLAAPALVRRSEAMATAVVRRQPRWLADWVRYYHGRLERVSARQRRNRLWQLSRKRFIQVAVEIGLVSGALIFSGPMLDWIETRVGRDWLFPNGPRVIFWTALCLLLIAPLIAVWRNISALALIYAQATTTGFGRSTVLVSAVETALKAIAGVLLLLWLVTLLPVEGTARWLLFGSAAVAIGAIFLIRQRLIYWHSHLEAELQTMMTSAENKMTGSSTPWFEPHESWNLHILDCVLPDLAAVQGRSIAELGLRSKLGCSVVGIERQGFMIPLPAPEAVLYPRDRVLLMGTAEQVAAGKRFLAAVTHSAVPDSVFEEVQMESMRVPEGSRAAGQTLQQLAPAQVFGLQIAGINRKGVRILNPVSEELIRAGDELLTLGTPEQTREFKAWLHERPDDDANA